jgi:hypothetical protein
MVNAFGYYASAKGMVLVPDLSGLSSAAAIALLESNGLNYSLGSDIDTNNGALDNLVAEQSPVSNTLVDYETVVQFRLYNLIVIPPFFPFFPSFPPSVALTATSTGETTTQLSWTASNFVQASYQIKRNGSVLGGGPINSTDTSGTDSGLQCGVNYTYEITIYSGLNGTGSEVSDSDSVTTDSCTTPTTWYGVDCCSGGNTYVSASNASLQVVLDSLETQCLNAGQTPGSPQTSQSGYPVVSCTPSQPPSFPSFPFFPPSFPPTPVGDPILGPCNQVFSGVCLANGGGTQSVTQNYSDGSTVVTSQCCTYLE